MTSASLTRPAANRPAVFLDRDGVLNQSSVVDGVPRPPQTAEAFQLLPGVRNACDRLKAAGFTLVVVTNQPDIARGKQSAEIVEQMHARLRAEVDVDEIVVCAHDDVDACRCRKPEPGMITDAAARLGIDLGQSYLVGDRWRDMEAARRAGVIAVHVDCHYDQEPSVGATDAIVRDLAAAADWILSAATNGATR